MKIKISKNQWEEMGKKAGWTNEKDENEAREKALRYERTRSPVGQDITESLHPSKKSSFSFGTTPEDIIKEKVLEQTPSGYSMHIKSQKEWSAIAKAVNQGIDSHLEGFTRSKFDNGKCLIHPEEMTTFLRRLYENGDEESWSLRSSILETLGIEEI
jgi:hypothetical protein